MNSITGKLDILLNIFDVALLHQQSFAMKACHVVQFVSFDEKIDGMLNKTNISKFVSP